MQQEIRRQKPAVEKRRPPEDSASGFGPKISISHLCHLISFDLVVSPKQILVWEKSVHFRCIFPERLRSRFRTPKGRSRGVPGPSPEAPVWSPRAPRAPLERPRDASGAPPELAWSAQRVQQGTGDLKTAPWDLKKLTPDASGTSFWSPGGLFFDMLFYVRWPQLADAAPNRTSQFPGGGGESPQASSIV